MTDDLERLWDDLPVGPAPLAQILREGRAGVTPTRRRPEERLRRSLKTLTVLGGVAAAFVAGTLVTGTGPGGSGPVDSDGGGGSPQVTPAAFQGELAAPESCDDLLGAYLDRALDVVGPYGWESDRYYGRSLRRLAAQDAFSTVADNGLAELAAAKAAPQRQVNSATGTNVQEQGVDEPDTVKTDGSTLYRLRDAELTTYDVTGSTVEDLGDVDLGDLHDGEMLLVGDTVVAIGDDGTPADRRVDDGSGVSPQTRVVTVDVADPSAPQVVSTVDYDTSLVSARQHGADVRLVLSAGLPDLDFVTPGGRGAARVSTAEATDENRALVEATTLDDWLPHQRVDGGEPTQFLDCDRVALPRADLGLDTMAVVGFGADDPGAVEALGLAGSAPLAYESPDHLYLAASGGSTQDVCFDLCDLAVRTSTLGAELDGTTHVYDFALDGVGATYVGAGEVEGSVADRWAMDEYDGVLRLAVGPTSETGSFNSVVTMRADGDRLVEVGRLDRLGVNEDLKSVRWFDGLAILVTFRQVDPLYVVDLTRQDRPTLRGELKVPGFSDYLHPLGSRRLIGLGSGRFGGGQAGFFDVTDVTNPRRLDVVGYGRTSETLAGRDPRQVTWLPGPRVLLTVVSTGYGRRGYVSALSLASNQMTNTMTPVEYGNDVAEVRLVPLPDGRVALMTGEDVRFFPVR